MVTLRAQNVLRILMTVNYASREVTTLTQSMLEYFKVTRAKNCLSLCLELYSLNLRFPKLTLKGIFWHNNSNRHVLAWFVEFVSVKVGEG